MREDGIYWITWDDMNVLGTSGCVFNEEELQHPDSVIRRAVTYTVVFPEGTVHTPLPDTFETDRHLYRLPDGTSAIVETQGDAHRALYVGEE